MFFMTLRCVLWLSGSFIRHAVRALDNSHLNLQKYTYLKSSKLKFLE